MGAGKIKNKDQLSLAEARVEAELGKKTSFTLFHVGSNTTYSTGDFAVSEPLIH